MKIYEVDLSKQGIVEPNWSAKIDRWYQLDELSYSFCEAIDQWGGLKEWTVPDIIFLALPEASNHADFDFVQTGAVSPAKFVYTLPNICASVILQMLAINTKVFCFHKGKNTYDYCLHEAQLIANTGKTIWLFSSAIKESKTIRKVTFQVLNSSTKVAESDFG